MTWGRVGLVAPVLDLFRAPIDNDRASSLARTNIGDVALAAGLDRLVHTTMSVRDEGDDLVVVTRSAAAATSNSMTTTWSWRAVQTDDGSKGSILTSTSIHTDTGRPCSGVLA